MNSEASDIIVNDISIWRNLPQEINTLRLNFFVKDEHLKYLSNVKINRLIITIIHNNDITNNGLIYLSTGNIKGIEMNISKITDSGLKYFVNFESVILLDGYHITNFGLRYLSNAKAVTLINFPNITHHGIKYLSLVQKLSINNIELFDLITTGGRNVEIDLRHGCNLKRNDLKYFSCVNTVILPRDTTLTSQLMRSLSQTQNIHLIHCNGKIYSIFQYLTQTQHIHFSECRPSSFAYLSMIGIKNIHIYRSYSECYKELPFGLAYLKYFDVDVMFHDHSDYKF